MCRSFTLSLLFALALPTQAWAHVLVTKNCIGVDYKELQKSVVSIAFDYDKPNEDGFVGSRGTAVFITPTRLATVGHVTDGVLEQGGGK